MSPHQMRIQDNRPALVIQTKGHTTCLRTTCLRRVLSMESAHRLISGQVFIAHGNGCLRDGLALTTPTKQLDMLVLLIILNEIVN